MKFSPIFIPYFVIIFLLKFTHEQIISYSMRKVSYSTNQFGLDLLRATKNDKLVFCPFCISSSLVMLLMGSTGEMATSLRHALYLNGLSENEINFAYFDMMNHLGVNLPTQKSPPVNLNFRTNSGVYNNQNPPNKASLWSNENQMFVFNSHLNNHQLNSFHYNAFNGKLKEANNKIPFEPSKPIKVKTNNQLFQSFNFFDSNRIIYPFDPLPNFNINTHHRNFIKFSTNQLKENHPNQFALDSNTKKDHKTSNRLLRDRTGKIFGFGKNGFWSSKSYLNPFSFIQNSFHYVSSHPSNYQIGIQPQSDLIIEKFGQNVNPSSNGIKLPNNFHYYNVKQMSSQPMNVSHNFITTASNTATTNRKTLFITNSLSTTTMKPELFISTANPNYNYNTFNRPQQHYIQNNLMNKHLASQNNLSVNYHSVRLGNMNSDITNVDFEGNDISFLSNIYVQRDFLINYHYHVLLQKFYKTCIHPLDFIHNADETREHINAIVQLQTDNKINNILPERQSPSTQLLLISALYFKGQLDLKLNLSVANELINYQQDMNDNLTSNNQSNVYYHNVTSGNITLNKNEESLRKELNENYMRREKVWMEASKTRLRYAFDEYLNCSTVEMPFKDSMITLLIMIPNDSDGLDTLLTKLNAQMLNDVINSLEIRRISIKLPKINIESSFRNLTTALADLGLFDLFRSGYSQLNNISDSKRLYVSDIIHKTHLNIKESSIHNQKIIISKSRDMQENYHPDIINIELNKSFLFFIMDNVSGLIMSMGKF